VHLGVLGSVIPSKGVLELARALRKARAPGLVLDVHGNLPSYHGDGSYVEELRALAREEPRVRIHGEYKRADLAGILAGLDGVAAPSRWEEVYGLTVREAAAAGVPVLVSDAGGLPGLVEGGGAGVVVARDDEAGWVRALERFAVDGAARAEWARGRPRLRTVEEMAEELEGVYVAVVKAVTGRVPEGAREEAAHASQEKKRGFLGRLFGRG
jgi:glycosyltransferase involved in cell wall biosynthesis